MYKQGRPSGKSLKNYVAPLLVEVGQPCTTASFSKYLTRAEVHTGFWWENPKGGDHWEDLGVDGKIILKWIFEKCDGKAWTGLLWLRIGTGGWRLRMR